MIMKQKWSGNSAKEASTGRKKPWNKNRSFILNKVFRRQRSVRTLTIILPVYGGADLAAREDADVRILASHLLLLKHLTFLQGYNPLGCERLGALIWRRVGFDLVLSTLACGSSAAGNALLGPRTEISAMADFRPSFLCYFLFKIR